jgi:hypothetical protein
MSFGTRKTSCKNENNLMNGRFERFVCRNRLLIASAPLSLRNRYADMAWLRASPLLISRMAGEGEQGVIDESDLAYVPVTTAGNSSCKVNSQWEMISQSLSY